MKGHFIEKMLILWKNNRNKNYRFLEEKLIFDLDAVANYRLRRLSSLVNKFRVILSSFQQLYFYQIP